MTLYNMYLFIYDLQYIIVLINVYVHVCVIEYLGLSVYVCMWNGLYNIFMIYNDILKSITHTQSNNKSTFLELLKLYL